MDCVVQLGLHRQVQDRRGHDWIVEIVSKMTTLDPRNSIDDLFNLDR